MSSHHMRHDTKSRKTLFGAYNKPPRDDYFLRGITANVIQRLWHTRKYQRIFSLLSEAAGSLLDVGCGNGIFCHEAMTRGYEAVGVDLSIAFLRRGKSTFRQLQVILADASSLPFRSSSFDIVVCMETLEHLPDVGTAVRELGRVIGPNGSCVTFNQDDRNLIWKVSWFLWRKSTGAIWEDLHVTEISPVILCAAMSQHGLVPNRFEREHFLMSFAIKALKRQITSAVVH